MSDYQPSLFDDGDERETLPYQPHSDTSHAAAIAGEPNAGTQRARVLELLRKAERGLTDEEMQRALRMNPSTERPRRIELTQAGRVVDSGRTRETLSGRKAVVWVAL